MIYKFIKRKVGGTLPVHIRPLYVMTVVEEILRKGLTEEMEDRPKPLESTQVLHRTRVRTIS